MPQFGNVSKIKLAQCHPDLQALFHAVIQYTDCAVICGYRDEKEQREAYLAGHSKAQFGESPHNSVPSLAADVVPYPIDWNNIQRFKDFGELVKKVAKEQGIKIVWGGDFKSFKDYPHFELESFSADKRK